MLTGQGQECRGIDEFEVAKHGPVYILKVSFLCRVWMNLEESKILNSTESMMKTLVIRMALKEREGNGFFDT